MNEKVNKDKSTKEPAQQTERMKALSMALSQIERQFGKGSVMKLGDASDLEDIEVISTGSIGLDAALGVGGLPKGRVIEIYGPESSGKTTLTLEVIAQCQKQGGTAAFIDAEHALDPIYAKKLGVKVEELLISQPDTGEQALEIADMLVRSGGIDVLVIDSVAALTPKAEIEGEMGDSHMGLQARLMSQALRKLTANIKRAKTLVIFINQIRMKIGVMFGSPETTTGGNALKFYASVRLDIRRIGNIKKGEEIIGSETRVKVVKNKVAPPFKMAEFDIMYNQGISKEGEMIEWGSKLNIIEKSGAWYSYGKERIGQGKDNVRQYLIEHPELSKTIEDKIRQEIASHHDIIDLISEEPLAGGRLIELKNYFYEKSLRNIALDLLAFREHSCFELAQKLSIRSFAKEEIDLVIEKLKQEGLISDKRFTESYIKSRFERGFGPKRIEQELTMKGVDETLIDDLLWREPWDWPSLIELEYYKKFKSPSSGLNEKLKRTQFLYYRGFTIDMIRAFFKKIKV